MPWTNQWPVIQGAWPKENQWLKDLREQNEWTSKQIKLDAEAVAKVHKDAALYGVVFIKDGKHIPLEDIYKNEND